MRRQIELDRPLAQEPHGFDHRLNGLSLSLDQSPQYKSESKCPRSLIMKFPSGIEQASDSSGKVPVHPGSGHPFVVGSGYENWF